MDEQQQKQRHKKAIRVPENFQENKGIENINHILAITEAQTQLDSNYRVLGRVLIKYPGLITEFYGEFAAINKRIAAQREALDLHKLASLNADVTSLHDRLQEYLEK